MSDKTSSWPEEDRGVKSDPVAEKRTDTVQARIAAGVSMDCYRTPKYPGSKTWCIVNSDVAMTECGYVIVGQIKRRVPTCPECLDKVLR